MNKVLKIVFLFSMVFQFQNPALAASSQSGKPVIIARTGNIGPLIKKTGSSTLAKKTDTSTVQPVVKPVPQTGPVSSGLFCWMPILGGKSGCAKS